jgi:translation initiation factor IF-3
LNVETIRKRGDVPLHLSARLDRRGGDAAGFEGARGGSTFPRSRPHRPGHASGPFSRPGGPAEVTAIKDQRVRINDQIRISPIRLIDAEGGQVGIVSLDEARERASTAGLDLVEVAPDARPPVCRLMDYGKYKYEEARKAREARKKQHNMQVKEVKYRPGIEDHDYEFKTRHVRRFLEDGDKVKVTMMFRGRQMSHPEIGLEVLERVLGDVEDVGKIESQPVREGRTMIMVLAPLSTKS